MRYLIKSALCTLQDQIHLKYVGRLGPANNWPTYCVRSWLQSSHQESLRLQLFHVTGAQTSSYHKLIRFCYLKSLSEGGCMHHFIFAHKQVFCYTLRWCWNHWGYFYMLIWTSLFFQLMLSTHTWRRRFIRRICEGLD